MLFQCAFRGFILVLFIQNGSKVYFLMLVIKRYFSVQFQILEQIYFIDDLPELFLYIGSIKNSGGIL